LTLAACGRYLAEYIRFRSLEREQRFPIRWRDRLPCLHDRTAGTGFDPHYIYHPAWAARVLAETRPVEHLDISSSLHFCSLVSAFVPVRFLDYRPAELGLDALESGRADILALPFPDGSVASLSCMHVVEHIGLGRYGDPLDPEGDLKAMAELRRVLAPGGDLLFVVPVGQRRLMFNAHRIYSWQQVRSAFSDLELREFALIPDAPAPAGLIRHADPALVEDQSYACGCFWLRKRG
jgi:SAM-dependent methyltransferase